jgi:hypothetical protein
MNTVTQAIIPQLGESVKSSHLYSLAEAFNSRILSGAGDSHWRIPYYIFSAFFRKPRLDDNMLYTPESEFFDFYQFVNPSTGETWPTNPPQEPEGANLQTNFLNRFIFGMNYQTKDNKDGAWLYEREDVRVQMGQDKLKNDAASFRGFVFPFFTAVGTDSGVDREFTSFGISSEIYSNGYISGNPTNPQGNSFGGYYGKNPLIIDAAGCGSDSVTGYEYPLSISTVIKIDGARDDKNSVFTYNVCNEGKGDVNSPDQYTTINDRNPYSILAFTIKNDIPTDVDVFAKNKYHSSQFQSTVFFGRELKNHIHRLLYNYITYAKGFDFDWFFNNQYSYAPEIGSFIKMISTYDQNPDQYYGRLNLLSTDIQISQARLTLQKTGLSASKINNGLFDQNGTTAITISFTSTHSYLVGDYIFISFYNSSGALLKTPVEGYYFITGKSSNTITVQGSSSAIVNGIVDIRNFLPIISGYNAKVIDDSAYIQTKYYQTDGKTLITKENITGTNSVFNYLLNNDFLAKGWEYLLNSPYLYTYDNNDPDKVVVPLGFALNNIQITSSTLKRFTLTIHYYVNGVYVNYRDIKIDYTVVTPGNTISKAISSDIFLATTIPEIVYSVKFEIRDIEMLSPYTTASVNLQPIFLFAYKPKIEDAYALLRCCTYYGIKDGNLDDLEHPLKRAYYFSDRLKDSGVLGYGDVPKTEGEVHTPLSVELNTNAVYEASRRLSLYARIVKPDNFLEILNDNQTLRFKRYSMQSANTKGPRSSLINYGPRSSLTVPYNVFATDDVINRSDIIAYLIDWTGYDSVYYSKFKKYNFLYETESNKINSQLNNDLVASLSNSTNYPTRVNFNNVEFEPTSYKFNYDSLVEGSNGKYLYYQFEDQYGVKFNNGDEDAPNYYAKRYTSENGSSSTNVTLDESGVISLDSTDLIFLGQTNSKKASFNIYSFTRIPNSGGLANAKEGGRQFYHVDKNGSFVTRPRTDLWRYNYSGTQAVKSSILGGLPDTTLPDDAVYSNLTYPNQTPIISAENIIDTDFKSSYILSLTELTELTNLLYVIYMVGSIQLNRNDASISYVENSIFDHFETFTDINDYNKYLAGYKIKISYFKSQATSNSQKFDNSIELAQAVVNLYTLNSSNNIINTYSYSLDVEIPLPILSGSEIAIKIEIDVNNRVDKNTKDKVNLDVYLAIINATLLEDDPILEAINREGGVLIERSAKLINTDTAAPTSRDIFQGIAPSIDNVLTGSLLVGQEYKVSGGAILHNGENYGVGYSSTFIAVNTQYSITSGSTPLVIQNNGIIEIAPPSGFTNEWAFWINFLPYSGSPTSSFKEEVYGATNSPFIDRCHINSSAIVKSEAENPYFNLGLPKTYIPEMPPSYRYVPLLTRNGLIYENLVGDSNYKNNFYRACPAFKPPYKIKKAYVSSSDGYNSVYIELDRKIDGHSISESATATETYRTDYNGLNDWTNRGSGVGKLGFRLGDASLTNIGGFNQIVSNTSNGYQGSYYPRFFFVKLMPKPYSDKNNTGEDLKDSPLNHDAIKQAELYLEAMREGFTANSFASKGRLSCANIKGHLTPPDYKYDQLFINSTTTADYFGNKWPSLLTSSINFNLAALRSEDNPRGFGAIPFVGTYLEPYAAIAKSINSLINFRVPFPLSFTATQYKYTLAENITLSEWTDASLTRVNGATSSSPKWANFNSPSGVSDILSPANLIVTTYNLRNSSGALNSVGAAQGYQIGDTESDPLACNINKAFISKYYISTALNINGIDQSLKNIAYSEVSSLLPNIFTVPVFIQKSSSVTKLVPTILQPNDGCSRYYSSGSGASLQYFELKTVYTDPYISCEPRGDSVINPDSLQVGKPFYRVIEPVNCSSEANTEPFNRSSFMSSSSTTYTIFEPGFQIITLNTKNFNSDDIT